MCQTLLKTGDTAVSNKSDKKAMSLWNLSLVGGDRQYKSK